MASTNFTIKVRYEAIGDHHILVHLHGCKVNHWMLLDLADISSRTGKTYEQIIHNLTERKEVT